MKFDALAREKKLAGSQTKMRRVVVQFLSPDAIIPTQSSAHAAGWDLYAAQSVTVPARGRALVPTNISFAIPREYYGRIAPRSGLALKNGIDVGAGVVDSDYRGDVGVLLFNLSDADFDAKHGDRVAQIIFTPCPPMTLVASDSLSATERDFAGFGSTGR